MDYHLNLLDIDSITVVINKMCNKQCYLLETIDDNNYIISWDNSISTHNIDDYVLIHDKLWYNNRHPFLGLKKEIGIPLDHFLVNWLKSIRSPIYEWLLNDPLNSNNICKVKCHIESITSPTWIKYTLSKFDKFSKLFNSSRFEEEGYADILRFIGLMGKFFMGEDYIGFIDFFNIEICDRLEELIKHNCNIKRLIDEQAWIINPTSPWRIVNNSTYGHNLKYIQVLNQQILWTTKFKPYSLLPEFQLLELIQTRNY